LPSAVTPPDGAPPDGAPLRAVAARSTIALCAGGHAVARCPPTATALSGSVRGGVSGRSVPVTFCSTCAGGVHGASASAGTSLRTTVNTAANPTASARLAKRPDRRPGRHELWIIMASPEQPRTPASGER
jgi:hypothetical protein